MLEYIRARASAECACMFVTYMHEVLPAGPINTHVVVNNYALLFVAPEAEHPEITSVSFLVSVNLTWGNCIQTVRTPPLKPNQKWNETTPITVGSCDHGPLTYTINQTPTERMSQEPYRVLYLLNVDSVP